MRSLATFSFSRCSNRDFCEHSLLSECEKFNPTGCSKVSWSGIVCAICVANGVLLIGAFSAYRSTSNGL
jgi:hypothetical protein